MERRRRSGSPWFRPLAGEHAALIVLIERVEKLIAGGLALSDARFLASMLQEILEHCRRHMALEERDGYLPVVRQRLPNAEATVERLLAEWSKGRKLYGHLFDDILKLKYLHQRYTNYLKWLQWKG